MDILEMFKKVHINIPLLDAVNQFPSYAKFLKDACINKRKCAAHGKLLLTEECSTVLLNKFPPKLKDPRSFTIPCIVGDVLERVKQLVLPIDFFVLDMEKDRDIPLLLGRPFLVTASTLIDVQQGTLTLRVQGESIEFKALFQDEPSLWHLLAKDHTKTLDDKAIVRKEFGQQPKHYMEEVAFFATSAPP
ncbi:hypothetical protein L3X38_032651 [Prunus dulcis]|uniref:Uncharacterized protein n=1 Tax=Prunus dulcis TaxID=3755 RepID=A0AAD4VEE4_PRUDU|nr:hypothetical protein L3X38_032651 [Prunus dulcis]